MIYKILKIFFCFFIISCSSKENKNEKQIVGNDKQLFNQAVKEIKNNKYIEKNIGEIRKLGFQQSGSKLIKKID